MRLAAYVRVSTDEQGSSGLGLEAQRASIEAYCNAHGHELVSVHEEVGSGGDASRPVLAAVLDNVGSVDGLIVAKLDRLARSVIHTAEILDRSSKEGWQLVALDLGVDTSTAAGRLVASVLAAVASWEREVIGERTSAALRAKKARGEQVGREPIVTLEQRNLIRMLRHVDSHTYREIQTLMRIRGILSPEGKGDWPISTIERVCKAPGPAAAGTRA